MPRRTLDEREEPPKRKPNAALWLVLAVCVAISVCGVAGTLAAWGLLNAKQGVPTGAKQYTREEFRAMLVGKSKEDVLKLAGKPDVTQDGGRTEYWYYNGRTADPITGKTDVRAQVVINDGSVSKVNY
jgi:outer membrane protein assembly factor BamE (lipoprotein component of BamABCDE complex)